MCKKIGMSTLRERKGEKIEEENEGEKLKRERERD